MKKEHPDEKKPSELHKKAEKKIKPETIGIKKLSDAEVRRLAHKLQVCQIELEMKNEELRKTRLASEELCRKYLALYDYAPVGYLTIDHNGLIIDANLTLATMLGIERGFLINKLLSAYITREYKDKYYLYRRKNYEKLLHNSCELKMVKKGGAAFHVQLKCEVARDSDENPKFWKVIVTDITRQKWLGEELKKSERRLNETQRLAKTGSWEYSLENKQITWSNGQYKIFGYEPAEFELTYHNIVKAVHPNDRKTFLENNRRSINENKSYSYEYRIIRPDGAVLYLHSKAILIKDDSGKLLKMQGTSVDVSEQKQAALKLKETQRQLESLVDKRTRELKGRVAELERYHDATVDRELRIKELRDENEKLKDRLKKRDEI
ncbi:uncharacterized protein SCALIN_C03_0164 [Candidatus Scalindua japonica]|uniref:histidine kinase n=1 Tax=Candidatus Scalindua japonica TaxID=1284222 RepID=A0A286TUE1_9BACT|nr:PAS domain-containing protein [Candidatus Scalindua japonica]GAX59507.1 uncharacterized protein SCALIN_C03_0164 [Candidatus Scalindua japonica]